MDAPPGKYLLQYGHPTKNLKFSKTNETENRNSHENRNKETC